MKLAGKIGKKWSLIARQMPGRTENQVKNRLNSMLKRSIITEEAFVEAEETEEARGDSSDRVDLDEPVDLDNPVVSPILVPDEPEDFLSSILREV